MYWGILKRWISDEKRKKLIIASALSIMAASCYAGSLVSNTSTSVSADVNFS
ncbi:Saf-pilin pilus formation protein SafA, partial [Salmonella enterica]|nr:Saf-pilin pilus formation protein SafA [Salmonella enterica]